MLPRIEHNFRAVVLLVAKHLVHLWRFVNRHAMTDHEARINFLLFDSIEQRLHVFHHVRLAGLHADAFVHVLANGEIIDKATINTRHGDGSSFATRHDALVQHAGTARFYAQSLLGAVDEVGWSGV